MTALVGNFSLAIALLFALTQTAAAVIRPRRRDPAIPALAASAALGQCAFFALAFACLVYAFVMSDFSLSVVAANTTRGMLSRLSGVRGDHEGSVLLWATVPSVSGAAIALFGPDIPDRLRARALAVLGAVCAAFLALMIAVANPFAVLSVPSADGAGLAVGGGAAPKRPAQRLSPEEQARLDALLTTKVSQ